MPPYSEGTRTSIWLHKKAFLQPVRLYKKRLRTSLLTFSTTNSPAIAVCFTNTTRSSAIKHYFDFLLEQLAESRATFSQPFFFTHTLMFSDLLSHAVCFSYTDKYWHRLCNIFCLRFIVIVLLRCIMENWDEIVFKDGENSRIKFWWI